MVILLQQEKYKINDIYNQVKKMLKLHEITTKFLAAWGLNVQKSATKLKKSCRYLAIAEAGTSYQDSAVFFQASKCWSSYCGKIICSCKKSGDVYYAKCSQSYYGIRLYCTIW